MTAAESIQPRMTHFVEITMTKLGSQFACCGGDDNLVLRCTNFPCTSLSVGIRVLYGLQAETCFLVVFPVPAPLWCWAPLLFLSLPLLFSLSLSIPSFPLFVSLPLPFSTPSLQPPRLPPPLPLFSFSVVIVPFLAPSFSSFRLSFLLVVAVVVADFVSCS